MEPWEKEYLDNLEMMKQEDAEQQGQAPQPQQAPVPDAESDSEPYDPGVWIASKKHARKGVIAAVVGIVAVIAVAAVVAYPMIQERLSEAEQQSQQVAGQPSQESEPAIWSHSFAASADGWAAATSTPLIVHATGTDELGGAIDAYKAIPAEGVSAWELPAGEVTLHFVSPINADGTAYEVPSDIVVSEPREIIIMLAPLPEAALAERLALILGEIEAAVETGIETAEGDGGVALLRQANSCVAVSDLSVIVESDPTSSAGDAEADTPNAQGDPASTPQASVPGTSAPADLSSTLSNATGTTSTPQQGSAANNAGQANTGATAGGAVTVTPGTSIVQGPSSNQGSSSGSAGGTSSTTTTVVTHTHVWTKVMTNGDAIYVDGDPIYIDGAPIYETVSGQQVVTGYEQILVGYEQVLTGYEQVLLGYKCYSCGSTKAP